MFPKAFLAAHMAACMALCWHVCIVRAVIRQKICGKCVNSSSYFWKLRTNLPLRRTNILAQRTYQLTGRTKRRCHSQNPLALFSKYFCPVLLSFLPLLFVPLSCVSFASFQSFCPSLRFPASLSSLPSVCLFLSFCRFLFFFLSLPGRCKPCVCCFFETSKYKQKKSMLLLKN